MIVLIAGMPRSGSTFSFNVARELLSRRGGVYHETGPDLAETMGRASDAPHILLKAHEYTPMTISLVRYGAIRAICTVRAPEDAVASWIEFLDFPEEATIEVMRRWFDLYRQIAGYALTVPYDTIDRRPWRAAWTIGRYLCRTPGLRETRSIARLYAKANIKQAYDGLARSDTNVKDVGLTWYNQTTFYHRRHVSSLTSRRAEQRLAPDQAARIRAEFSEADRALISGARAYPALTRSLR